MLGLFLFPLAVLGARPHRPGTGNHSGPSWAHAPSPGGLDNASTIETTTTIPPTIPSATCSSTDEAPALTTTIVSYGSSVEPKVLFIANEFEFEYLIGYNFTTQYTGPLLDSTFACTADGETCMFACRQELVSASQLTALFLVPGIDLSKTYIFVTGTGGVNPRYGTAGGVAISRYSVQWEWGGMFLGSELPKNFSG
jgi:purine nucleoside permease